MPTPQARPSPHAPTSPISHHRHSWPAPHAQPQGRSQANPHVSSAAPSQATPQEPPPPPRAYMQSPRRQAPGSGQRAQFRAGQVVWAKCRGYPWWPARVSPPVLPPCFSVPYCMSQGTPLVSLLPCSPNIKSRASKVVYLLFCGHARSLCNGP